MMVPADETELLQAFFDQHRIPLFLYDERGNRTAAFHTLPQEQAEALAAFFRDCTLAQANPELDIQGNANELYFCFRFAPQGRNLYLQGGPVLLAHLYQLAEVQSLSFAAHIHRDALKPLTDTLPVMSYTAFCATLRLMLLALGGKNVSLKELYDFHRAGEDRAIDRAFAMEHFENIEDALPYSEYREETQILACVREGDEKRLESVYRALPQTRLGNMSTFPLKRYFYGGIVNTTLVTRAAIVGGMEEKAAFTLSDVYIRKMESCITLVQIQRMNEQMVLDFTRRVKKADMNRKRQYSDMTKRCLGYIAEHIHQPVALADLSRITGFTAKYISCRFHQDTGISLHEYIRAARVEEAKNLLAYSALGYARIGELLCFVSQSHFIAVFRKAVGVTPRVYRETCEKTGNVP